MSGTNRNKNSFLIKKAMSEILYVIAKLVFKVNIHLYSKEEKKTTTKNYQ